MESLLRRYWFRFEATPTPGALGLGCGVTAFNLEDALRIAREVAPSLTIKACIEDVDISELDQSHVIPNMGLVTERGVWYPLGFR
jgi:hypothetical protein